MLTIEEAREWLRLDSDDNDLIIQGLLDAVPPYIETATDLTPEEQEARPLSKTVAKFLVHLWYNAEQAEAERLRRTIDNLLVSLKMGP